jgi:hypothetical protein
MLPPLVRFLTCFRIDFAGGGVAGGLAGMSDPRNGASRKCIESVSSLRGLPEDFLATGLGNGKWPLLEYVDDVTDALEGIVDGGWGQDALIIDDAPSPFTTVSRDIPESRSVSEPGGDELSF